MRKFLPPLRDARYLQTLILLGYAFAARQFFYLERDHVAGLLCVLWAVSLDLLLGFTVYKKPIFPLSAIIVGLSSSILIDARSWHYYLLVVTIAILSKALITYQGKHIFNPSNFGVVVVLLLFPHDTAGIPHLFAGGPWLSLFFGTVGILTVLYAGQAVVSFSWIAGFLLFALVRGGISGAHFNFVLGPALSSSFLLFSFHMISDPGTTPKTPRYAIAFGAAVALVDAVLRYWKIPFGQFYALFLVSTALPWIRDSEFGAAKDKNLSSLKGYATIQ